MAVNLDAELYYLLAPMIASETITFEQAQQWIDFRSEAKAQHPVPMSLAAAVDMALNYFRADPDTEAAAEAQRVAESHAAPHGHCCECGEPLDSDDLVTDVDFEMSLDLWLQVREMVRLRDAIEADAPGLEEC